MFGLIMRRLALASTLIVIAVFCATAETGMNKTSNANSDQKCLTSVLKGIAMTPCFPWGKLNRADKVHDLCRRFGVTPARVFRKLLTRKSVDNDSRVLGGALGAGHVSSS